MNLRDLLIATSLFATACAGSKLHQSTYDHLSKVPASFLASYPNGNQLRTVESVQAVFVARGREDANYYQRLLARRNDFQGQIDVAVAVQPSGVVEAVGLIASSFDDPKIEQAIMQRIMLLRFGPAPGEGLFVFWYPIKFASG